MTGTNYKKNNLKKSIILFDSSISFDRIIELRKNHDNEIIPLDFPSLELLISNKIKYISSDEFFTKSDMYDIQKKSFLLSDWYKHPHLEKILNYYGVNLGSTIQSEFINITVNFLKNLYLCYKISIKFPNSVFFCSNSIVHLLKNFTTNYSIIQTEPKNSSLPLDSLRTNVNVGFKNFNLSTKNLNRLKSFSENFSKLLVRKKIKNSSVFYLFSEFNTKKFSELFCIMPDFNENFVIFNRRQPSIWDKESLDIFKKSKAILENEKTLMTFQKKSRKKNNSIVETIIKNLKSNQKILDDIFIFHELRFWPFFKNIFYDLIYDRFNKYSYDVDLSNMLLEKYRFQGILIQNEVGPNEKILIQLARVKKIPIFLLQHGLIFDTSDALSMNKYQGVMGYDCDYQLVWGNIDFEYRIKHGFNPKKIFKIGSPIFDSSYKIKNSKKDYVLLATSGPTKEDIFDLSLETISKNVDTIKNIAKIVSQNDQKLIIKLHPSPDEYDPSDMISKIDDSIQVIKSGNIDELISRCSLMIMIDLSSVLIDAFMLNKPVISIGVKDNGYGTPSALINNSCEIVNLENLEQKILDLLNQHNSQQIQKQTHCLNEYITNIGSSSKKLLSVLSNLQN